MLLFVSSQFGRPTIRYHRNQASEFNAIVKMKGEYSGFVPGGSFYTPFYTGAVGGACHGVGWGGR
jgi:hypothetical protein